MPAPDFWAEDAEAMELTMAGTRLIVQELAEMLRSLGRRMRRPRWLGASQVEAPEA